MNTRTRPALVGIAAAIAALLAATPAVSGQVKLLLRDGRVTLTAENATVREILAEWARVGKTTIVNGDKLPGPPITIDLQDVPEERALESLLRSAGGYILAPRAELVAGASSIERVLIYPVAAPPVASAPSSTPTPRPVAGQSPGMPYGRGRGAQSGGDPDDENLAGAPRAMGGAVGVRPPETTFDYANPMQIRQANEQGGNPVGGVAGSDTPGVNVGVQEQTAPVNPYGTSLVNPYTGQPVSVPQPSTPSTTPGVTPGSATRPGVMVPNPNQPQGTFQNPYGLPTGIRPGSAVGPPVEPDRSKYTNPPAPPAAGGGRGGRGGGG